MRIRDYIRDGLAMGQKRNNKSGLQDAASCYTHACAESRPTRLP